MTPDDVAARPARPGVPRRWLCAAVLASAALPARAAEAWPSRPIRLVAPLAPGGSVDIIARLVASALTPALGQRVVVENRPGASGNVGVQAVATAVPDGYTLVLGSSSTFGANPSLFKSLPYDPIKGFAPISQVSVAPNVLVVTRDLPVSSVADLVTLAKRQPGRLSFASSGYGGSPHLAGELFKASAGIDIAHIPYKGTGSAMADLLTGRVQMSFATVLAVLDQVKAGQLKALAVTGDARVAALPSVPTIVEAGYPEVRITGWNGVLAPAGTPKAVIDELSDAIRTAVRSPDLSAKLQTEGAIPVGSTPPEFAAFIAEEIRRWAAAVHAAGLVAQ